MQCALFVGRHRAGLRSGVLIYSASQPHHDAILICILAFALLGATALKFCFGFAALPVVVAWNTLSPVLVVVGFTLRETGHGLGSVLDADACCLSPSSAYLRRWLELLSVEACAGSQGMVA